MNPGRRDRALHVTGKRIVRETLLRFAGDRSGAMAITIGLMMTSLAGMVALSVDVADWYGTRRAMQSEADSAALGGAMELFENGTTAQITAAATTDGNLNRGGMVNGAALTVSVDSTAQVVTATMTKTADMFFSRLFLGSAPAISVTAKAGLANGGPPVCLLVTNPSASSVVYVDGSSSIQATGCAVVVDSSSASAMQLQGGTSINAKAICGPGGNSAAAGSTYNPTPTLCAAISDPLANWPAPAAVNNPCDYTGYTVNGNNTATYKNSAGTTVITTYGSAQAPLLPGVYCGGINLAQSGGSANVVFQAGTYILRNGGLVTGGSTVATGTGVSLYLSGTGDISLNNSTTLTITAPTSGEMAGIAIYEDHSQPTGTVTNYFQGNSALNFTGVLYFGSQNVYMNGSSSNNSAGYTSMVVNALEYEGYSTLYLNSNYAGTNVPVPPGLVLPVVALLQ